MEQRRQTNLRTRGFQTWRATGKNVLSYRSTTCSPFDHVNMVFLSCLFDLLLKLIPMDNDVKWMIYIHATVSCHFKLEEIGIEKEIMDDGISQNIILYTRVYWFNRCKIELNVNVNILLTRIHRSVSIRCKSQLFQNTQRVQFIASTSNLRQMSAISLYSMSFWLEIITFLLTIEY